MNQKLILVAAGLAIAAGLVYAGYLLGGREVTIRANALCVANFPEPTPLGGDDFGATTLKVMEQGLQYRKARKACIPE